MQLNWFKFFFTSPQNFISNGESKLSVTRKEKMKQAMDAKRIYFSLILSNIKRSEPPKLVACHQIDCQDTGVTQDITFSSPSRWFRRTYFIDQIFVFDQTYMTDHTWPSPSQVPCHILVMSKDTVQQKIFLPCKIIMKQQQKKDQASPFKDWSFRLNVAW